MGDLTKIFKTTLGWFIGFVLLNVLISISGSVIATHFSLSEQSFSVIKTILIFLSILAIICIPIKIILNIKCGFKDQVGLYATTKKIKPKDFEIENYIAAPHHINRQSDKDIEKIVIEEKHVLILGQARIGKTTAAFEICKKLKSFIVIKLRIKSFEIENISYPFISKKNLILFLDDIEKYDGKLIRKVAEYLKNKSKKLIVIATCCSGDEYEVFEEQNISMGINFNEVTVNSISEKDGMNLARTLGKDWDKIHFDGTPACIISRGPDDVSKRIKIKYKKADKGCYILKTIKLLKESGINYYETELVKKICEDIFGLFNREYEWLDMIRYLVNNKLIELDGEYIKIWNTYLDYCIDKDDFCLADYYNSLRKIIFSRGKLFDIVKLGYGHIHRKNFVDAEECFKFALDIYSRYVPALNGLGSTFIESGKNKEKNNKREEAKADFMEAVAYLENSKNIKPLASTHLKLGHTYSLLKDNKNAEQEYRIATKMAPNNFGAQAALGYLLVDLGKYSGGEIALREAIRINPDSSLAHCNLGFCLKLVGKTDEAEKEFRQAIDLNKNLPQAHKQLASVLADKNNKEAKEEAEKEFRCVTRLNPDDPLAHADLAYFLANNTKKYDNTEDEYKKVLALDPDYVEILNNYGCFLRNRGRSKEAEEMHREAVKLRNDSALLHNNLALDLRAQDRRREAVDEFEEALRINPGYMEVFRPLGIILTELKEYKRATEIYRRAYELKPDYENIAITYVIAAEKTETTDKILQIYNELFKTQPDNINLVKTFAQYLYKFRNRMNVLEIIDKMIQANPKSLIENNPDILALKGEILRRSDEFETAEKYTKIALDLDPENIIANKNYAILQELAGDTEQNEQAKLRLYNKAEEFYKKVLSLEPSHPSAHRHRGNLLAKLKRRDREAENEYKEAINTKQPYPEGHRDYGSFLLERGRIEKGKEELKIAMDLFEKENNDIEVQKCKDILKKYGH